MKATAIALLVLGVYWVEQGITAIKQDDTANGAGLIVLGIVMLPIAKYVWGKNLGPKP